MPTFHPQYINDANGNKSLVVLPIEEFDRLLEELEELADVRSYDAAQAEDSGERVPFSEYLKKRGEVVAIHDADATSLLENEDAFAAEMDRRIAELESGAVTGLSIEELQSRVK